MTIVLTSAQTDWVFQVSDRRLTYFYPGKGIDHHDDFKNKMVLVDLVGPSGASAA